jgi:radical SAM protein with 4Fe4S-binding SPASM domain
MKKMFCPKPWENVLIEINGDVYFCCYSHRPEGMIGRLQRDNFPEIWDSKKATKIRKKIMAGKIPLACLDCELFRFEKKWVLYLRNLYLDTPIIKALFSRSKLLNDLKNRLRSLLYNVANLKK